MTVRPGEDADLDNLRDRLRRATGDNEGGKRVELVDAISTRLKHLTGRPLSGGKNKLRGGGCRCPGKRKGKHSPGCPFGS